VSKRSAQFAVLEIFEGRGKEKLFRGKGSKVKKSVSRLDKRMQKARDLFLQLIENHKKFNYSRAINETCGRIVNSDNSNETANDEALCDYDTQEEIENEEENEPVESDEVKKDKVSVLLKLHSTHEQVFSFLKRCLSKVIPIEMRGSRHNFSVLLKKIWRLIALNRFESFDENFLMKDIRVTISFKIHH
jgi:hypothetical protein